MVKGCKSLEDSFKLYIKPDLLSDGNQWQPSDGVKVDAMKGIKSKTLP